MKKIFYSLFVCACVMCCVSAFAGTFSCGDGYVLDDTANKKIDGIKSQECVKLWCRDLETGDSMGKGNNPANGYRATANPVMLDDGVHDPIMCFGDRKWCSGEPAGVWNPEYGAYTRGGADTATYQSYKKGGCFSWRLEKPECEDGMTAFLQNGEWVCAVSVGTPDGGRASTIRRTGAIRRR